MKRYIGILLFIFLITSLSYAQSDEIWLDSVKEPSDTLSTFKTLTKTDIDSWLNQEQKKSQSLLFGGYIQSIFHEPIDSVRIVIKADGIVLDSLLSQEGLFSSALSRKKVLLDLHISHPDYHALDTAFYFSPESIDARMIKMEPKYKILLRGRVFSGNMPQEGVDVNIRYGAKEYTMQTRGCFYDKEDYWNCLFDGMFKLDLLADNPNDSIHIRLKMDGMKPLHYGFYYNEYQGEIMQMRMKYENTLPSVPMNNINLKLTFPAISWNEDWFVSLSYMRLVNDTKLRRLSYGIDASMYMTNVTVTQPTLDGLDVASVDSSYIRTFAGPSLVFWIIPPEQRMLSTYAGATLAFNFEDFTPTPQLYIGTRYFLDLNKAINLEFRYSDFDMDVTHYTFYEYGAARRSLKTRSYQKLHFTLGIQIAF